MSQAVATFTDDDNGKKLELRVGDSVSLRLRENAATGYRWSLDPLDAATVGVREDAQLDRSGAVGGGGDMQWVMEAKAPGTVQVKLKLGRRWEGDASVKKRFEVTLIIRP